MSSEPDSAGQLSNAGGVTDGSTSARPGRRARGAESAQIIVISWRDIPAQVNAQRGRERQQVILSAKFQRAIDRAKRKANIYTAHEDIAQWRRVSRPCTDDLAAEAQAEAEHLEASYTKEHLGKLGFLGGWEPENRPPTEPPVDLTTLDAAGADEDPEDDPETAEDGQNSDWGTWSVQPDSTADSSTDASATTSDSPAPTGIEEGLTP